MARKSKSPSSETPKKIEQGMYWLPNDAAWGGFINIKLDDEQKQTFFTWFADAGLAVHQLMDDLLGNGAKVTWNYDRENSCYLVAVTGALVSGSNERYCVNSRAGTLVECMGLAVWKHFYLADGDFGAFRPASGKLNNWG